MTESLKPIDLIYKNPIFIKACQKLTDDDIQFFKDIQAWKVDLKNKKELKRRYKDIQLRMVADFNFREMREFIKIMRYITIYSNNNKKLWKR